jgi:hypothetical protein
MEIRWHAKKNYGKNFAAGAVYFISMHINDETFLRPNGTVFYGNAKQ